jgi:predicted kinase
LAKLTLLLGPVGAGKTTFGLKMAREKQAVFFNLDEWMSNLFRPDRPAENVMEWYINRVQRCKKQIQSITEKTLANGVDVVLEIGLVRKADRDEFFSWVDERQVDLKIYIFDVDRSIRRERVLQRNKEKGPSFSMEVPVDFFEFASDAWQVVENNELEERDHTIL